MSNAVKSKFAGFLRGLLRRMDDRSVVTAESAPRPVSAATPMAPGTPANQVISHEPVAATPASAVMTLSIAPIIASLPMELRAKIMTVPPAGMTVLLPVETITSQLAFGAVKITFGELRRLAPGLFANSGCEHDQKVINLPLGEILPRLSPGLLARRSGPRVEVDSAINGPFGSRGNGVSITTVPLKPSVPAKPSVSAEKNAGHHPFELPPRKNTTAPAPAAPVAFTPPPAFEFPTKPVNGNGHRESQPSVPLSVPPVPPAPLILKLSAAPTPVPPAPTPAPVPPAPVAPRLEPAHPTILASLWDLAENWPGELKSEILATSMANENVRLAGAIVEAGLKRGRVTMTWRLLRILAKPSSAPSVNDALELELPLKVIAPLFFAAQKKLTSSQKQAVVSAEIPTLFFGFPQAAPTPPAGAPRPVEKKSDDSNFYVWGDTDDKPQPGPTAENDSVYAPPQVPQTDFMSRQAQPKDVVARAKILPGVMGVVITLPDGLRVASDVPAEFNAETLAAFVPQIFERMNQSARELRMGALDNVGFTVGNVPWKIFRVNAVYVAAFGRAGESLPSGELAALAGELDRKKQP